MNTDSYLSKREQQIMELLYQRGRMAATEVCDQLPGKPSNSTVRTLLRILEEKNMIQHFEEEGRYVYEPVVPAQSAAKLALRGVMRTFFSGSVGDVVATLLTDESSKLNESELDRLQELIDEARKEGR